MARKTIKGRMLLFLLLGLQAVVSHAVNTAKPIESLRNIGLYARLGSGEPFTISKNELAELMGQEKAEQLFTSAQEGIQKRENERWWKGMLTAIVISLSVALTVVYAQVFKK